MTLVLHTNMEFPPTYFYPALDSSNHIFKLHYSEHLNKNIEDYYIPQIFVRIIVRSNMCGIVIDLWNMVVVESISCFC